MVDSNPGVSDYVWKKRFTYLIMAVTIIKLLTISVIPVGLESEECYYWNWGRILDWGYFSKPPMIAWLNALSTHILGATPFSVRLTSTILSIFTLSGVYALGSAMFDRRVGFYAVLTVVLSPAGVALGIPMTTDAPLLAFWSWSLYAFWRCVETNYSFKWFFISGLLIGFGSLSKQMMLVCLVLFPLFMLLDKESRIQFKRPGVYVMAIIGLLFLVPVLYWNSLNDWPTVLHTADHFDRGESSFFAFIKTFPEFIGGQLALISPVTCFLFGSVGIVFLKKLFRLERTVLYLTITATLPLALFTALSFKQEINANWPVSFYLPGVVLLAAWACKGIATSSFVDNWRRAYYVGLKIGAALVVIGYVVIIVEAYWQPVGGKKSPLYRMNGWKEIAVQIDQKRAELGKNVFFAADNRHVLSEMAFNIDKQPHLYMWNDDKKIKSQYDLWPDPVNKQGHDCILICKYGVEYPELFNSFESVSEPIPVSTDIGRGRKRTVYLRIMKSLKQWPSWKK